MKNEPNLLSLCITFDGRYSKANVGSSILSMFANRRRSSVISSGTEKWTLTSIKNTLEPKYN